MRKYYKKFISFLIVVAVLTSSAHVSFGADKTPTIEQSSEVATLTSKELEQFVAKFFKETPTLEESKGTEMFISRIGIDYTDIWNFVENEIINPKHDMYGEIYDNTKNYNDTQKQMGLLRKIAGGTSFSLTVAGISEAVTTKFPSTKLVSKVFGSVAIALLIVKLGHQWHNKGEPTKIISEHVHELTAALITVGGYVFLSSATGGIAMLPGVLSGLILAHKHGESVVNGWYNYFVYSGYDNQVEEYYNRFSMYRVTYIPSKEKFSYKVREASGSDPDGSKEDYDIVLDKEISPPWESGEYFLDFRDENLATWDKAIGRLFKKFANEPDKLEAAVNKFFNGYSMVYWRMPNKARNAYLSNYDLEDDVDFKSWSIKASQPKGIMDEDHKIYRERLKARAIKLVMPLLQKYFDEAMEKAWNSACDQLELARNQLNRKYNFFIYAYSREQATATGGKKPWIKLEDSKYKDYIIEFEPSTEPLYRLNSYNIPSQSAWDGDSALKIRGLGYERAGEPKSIRIKKDKKDKGRLVEFKLNKKGYEIQADIYIEDEFDIEGTYQISLKSSSSGKKPNDNYGKVFFAYDVEQNIVKLKGHNVQNFDVKTGKLTAVTPSKDGVTSKLELKFTEGADGTMTAEGTETHIYEDGETKPNVNTLKLKLISDEKTK